jgi:hypothetical protein
MSNVYEILDNEGKVINTINASIDFVEENYPGHYREVGPEPTPPVDEPPPPPKTEEEKIADATAAAITKLIADGVLKPG